MEEGRKARSDREIADVLDNLRRVFKVVHRLKELQELSDGDLKTTSEGLRRLVGILGVEGIPPPLLLSPEVNAPLGKIDDSQIRTGERP